MSTKDNNHGGRFAGRVKQAEDPLVKNLKIKINTLKRNLKDLKFAKNEVIQETNRLESVKRNNPERIKQQENVIGEAQMMISHSQNRVRTAIKDLTDFLSEFELSNKADELVQSAHQALEEGNCMVSQA